MSIWKKKVQNPLFTVPALALGLASGAAFALKKPAAHADEGKARAAFEKMGDSIESALRLDRVNLSKKLLKDEIGRGNLEKLRVHVDQIMFLEYDTGERESAHSVDSDGIEDVTSRDIHRVKLTPKVKGKIVAVADDDATLFITFDRDCNTTDCALKFVAEKGQYLLAGIPPKEGYANATAIATVLGFRYRDGALAPTPREDGSEGGLSNHLQRPFREQIALKVRKDTLTEVNVTKEKLDGVE